MFLKNLHPLTEILKPRLNTHSRRSLCTNWSLQCYLRSHRTLGSGNSLRTPCTYIIKQSIHLNYSFVPAKKDENKKKGSTLKMDAKGKSCILFFIYAAELEFKRQIDSPRRSWGSFLKFRSGIQASSWFPGMVLGNVFKVQSWNSRVKLIPREGPWERF